ncbi:magnesium transporter CorA family protein [Actinomadura scrupuli]|uniref:magnesium transporter CorA family protein n=1 Tax=Actinomadura scrupuli TaxID=559629 RepID=UPI003D95836C
MSGKDDRPAHRTRVWRNGTLEKEGFPAAQISDYLQQDDTLVWLDLCAPGPDDLKLITEELGLDQHAVEDAVSAHERAKLDRYDGHLFLNVYATRLDAGSGELTTVEVSAFITDRALVTVRQSEAFDVDALVEHWESQADLAKYGVAFLLHGLLDLVVDEHFDTVQSLDSELEKLEDLLFEEKITDRTMQRRAFTLRKSLVLLRRVLLPMREVVNTLLRRDLHVVPAEMGPYFQDVYDHTLRAAEWTDGLRDGVSNAMDTRLALQSNRLNEVMKKVTSWAAIIAVPTAVTGFYGMNVPYPGYGQHWGFVTGALVLVVTSLGLYAVFKKRGWL